MIYDPITNQPLIEAERFILRTLRKSDAGLLEMHTGDERVARGTRSIPHPLPPGSTDAFITRAMGKERALDVWVMDGSVSGHAEVVGLVSLTPMDRDQSEIKFWVAPAFWNTGMASEAVRAMVAANPHDSKTMFAEVFQDNPASARVVTNSGFDYLGDAEAYSVARDATVPTWTYVNRLED
ncbi:MAG: GNAT family N-acetyltransferase [Marinosulfonomonas sp.]|nr:MAG: GNAT family N-acetyltransferase [Marinosulfonomonas sp.]